MKRIALFAAAMALSLAVSNVSQANDCCQPTCCQQKSSCFGLSKLKSLFSFCHKSKCEPCCPAPAPTCAAPAAAPATAPVPKAIPKVDPAPVPKESADLTPSATEEPKK